MIQIHTAISKLFVIMSDEATKISAKTWNRDIDSINKVGYSDGVVDGQTASFQSSFDVGYNQGFEFGFNLGLKKAIEKHTHDTNDVNLFDPRRINCQICLNNNTINENIVNLYNRQHEKNKDYFQMQVQVDS